MTRRTFAVGVSIGVAVSAAGFAQANLSRFGVTDQRAQEVTMSAVEGTYSLAGLAKPFLALSPSGRTSAVNDAVAWAKAYLNSPGFTQAWIADHDRSKPAPPVVKGTIDDEVQQEIAAELQQAADMRKELANLPADQRPQMEALIKEMETKTKDPATVEKIRRDVTSRRADDQDKYQADLKKWQDEADPKALIAARLQDFVNVSADVDFDAKTEVHDGKKIFSDDQYEDKSNIWKMCYRAGREATTAARAAATIWLKELGR